MLTNSREELEKESLALIAENAQLRQALERNLMQDQTNLKQQLEDVILEMETILDPCKDDAMPSPFTYGEVRHWLEVLCEIKDELK